MRPLFESWRSVALRLRESDLVALFLDFDGTLAKICERPEEVVLEPSTRRVLARLARHQRLKVWVISGRRRADVRARVGVRGLRYLGLHGWEGRSPQTSAGRNSTKARGGSRLRAKSENGMTAAKHVSPVPQAARPGLSSTSRRALRTLRQTLNETLGKIEGIRIEDKTLTFAIHYRGASDASITAARAVLSRIVDSMGGEVYVIEGELVWEVLPRELGTKGAAVRRELQTLGGSVLPVYAGNDGTDEPAFAALADGVTIRVGPDRLSHARFRLSNPADLRRFLEKLEFELK